MRRTAWRERIVAQLAIPSGRVGYLAAVVMPSFHKTFYGPTADHLQLRPDDAVLDVACGSGVFLSDHAGHVERIAGLDVSDIQVELARRRLRSRIADGTAEIVVGDASRLPWEDETFTAVTCMGSMDYFSEPEEALVEMFRVLRPGGRIVVTWGINEDDVACVREADRWGIPRIPEDEARKVVESAGFALVEVSYHHNDRYLVGTRAG